MNKQHGTILYVEDRKKYRAYYSSNGKRISKYFDTKKAAKEWLEECHSDTQEGINVTEGKIALGQWSEQFIEAYAKPKVKYKTLLRYMEYARMVEPLGKTKLDELDSLHIQKFLNKLPTDSKKSKAYKYLSQILTKAFALRMIQFNPMLAVDAPSYTPGKLETFTDKELAKIKKELHNQPYEVFFLAAIATGCRSGELCGLTIQNVFKDHIHICQEAERKKGGWFLDTPKSKYSVRDVALPKVVIDMLIHEHKNTPSSVKTDFIFHRENGEPLLPDFVYRVWKKILYYADVPYRNFHYLRHTHATNLLHKFDFVEVQHRLGHSQASTTLDMYGHTKAEYNQKISKEIEKMVDK